MPESFQPLGAPFSTADAEAPALVYERGDLHVRFLNWQEREIKLTFRHVAAFVWEDGDAALFPDHRDDTSYLVADSDWLRRHHEVGSITLGEGHSHYKLCFNAAGVLQVLATGLEVDSD